MFHVKHSGISRLSRQEMNGRAENVNKTVCGIGINLTGGVSHEGFLDETVRVG